MRGLSGGSRRGVAPVFGAEAPRAVRRVKEGKTKGRRSEDDELIDINTDFVNTMIAICREVESNSPFPGWKDGLDELWN